MKRQFVLIPLLAVALVGLAKGQGTGEKETSAKKEVTKKFVQPTTQEVTLVIAPNEGMTEKDKAAEKAALAVESLWIGSFGDRKLLDSDLAPRLHQPRREMGNRTVARQNRDSACSHRGQAEACEHQARP